MLGKLAVEQQDAVATREAWIQARMAEFKADPAMRDRAIASILYDSLTLAQGIQEMTATVKREGLGGLFKAAVGAMRNGST
jgi:hypothetical protein